MPVSSAPADTTRARTASSDAGRSMREQVNVWLPAQFVHVARPCAVGTLMGSRDRNQWTQALSLDNCSNVEAGSLGAQTSALGGARDPRARSSGRLRAFRR